MTSKELLRYDVIKKLISGVINGTQAALQINLCVRQVKRLKAKVRKQGAKGVIHSSRGKKSNRKIPEKTIESIAWIIKERYNDFGPTLAKEKLKEIHHINIGLETLRQLMIIRGLWKPKPRRNSKKRHVWRVRKEYFGQMEQFDGCYHKWFEKRNDECCLLLSVDDAKGEITYAKFDINESVKAVFKFWLEYFSGNGLPVSIYLDKFSAYKVNHKNAVDNKDLITQFQRAMNQIGIEPITAHSPEAKGRVERVFETLQDRLVKELRLAGISTIKEANKFLETYIQKFNAKFAVAPQKKKDLHRTINRQLKEKLPRIFSVQSERVVHNDYTVMFKNRYFQLGEIQPATVYKKDRVIIEEHLDDSVKIDLKGHYLNYTVLPERPKKQIDIKLPAITNRKQSDWKPPIDHPWRRQFTFGHSRILEKTR